MVQVRVAPGGTGAMCTGLICRCFFAAFTQLTVQLPWKFGSRLSATFEGHGAFNDVESLAVLEGGRLASGSGDGTIKIWDSALADVLL